MCLCLNPLISTGLQVPSHRRLHTMTNIICGYAAERFSVVKKVDTKPTYTRTTYTRAIKIQLRQELHTFKKHIRCSEKKEETSWPSRHPKEVEGWGPFGEQSSKDLHVDRHFQDRNIRLSSAGKRDYNQMYHLSHPIRAFMDDLTVTTTSVPGVNWCCCNIQEVRTSCKALRNFTFTWARMSTKPTKSNSMVLKRGKVADKFHLS